MATKRLASGVLVLTLLGACDVMDVNEPGALVPRTVDQDPSLPSLAVNGTRLHVQTYGSTADPLLILIHGGPGGDFRSLLAARAFAADGFQVVFYDQRGSGLSQREDRRRFEQRDVTDLFVDDLDALIAHFDPGGSRRVFLMGHSWGAMLATAYINRHPQRVSGAVLAEPGGLTWPQAKQYVERANRIRLFSEALNDAIYPEHIFAGRSEHEVLDYKASFFSNYENRPGNEIGNAGPYPFWRSGAAVYLGASVSADRYGFDFTTNLARFTTEVLFLYSELSRAYGADWAATVSAAFPNARLDIVRGTGHEMLYFGWADFYPKALAYLEGLK